MSEHTDNHPGVSAPFPSFALGQQGGDWLAAKETNSRLAAINAELLEACKAAHALIATIWTQVNWGESPMNAEAIRLLNEVPLQITHAIAKATEAKP